MEEEKKEIMRLEIRVSRCSEIRSDSIRFQFLEGNESSQKATLFNRFSIQMNLDAKMDTVHCVLILVIN